jgi:membrane-bound lytic murein transglycosylase D
MKRSNLYIIALLLCLLGTSTAWAQDPRVSQSDQLDYEQTVKPYVDQLDDWVSEWNHALRRPPQKAIEELNKYGFAKNERPTYSAEVYERRLEQLNFQVPMDYNPVVETFIHVYTKRKPELLSRVLGLKQVYFPIIEATFDRHNIPQELKYMAVIESALHPEARSSAAATGLWQFMYGTGEMYGLEINSYVDERQDPFAASEAAARYLKDLYKIYENWHMVIAAYNCGPGRMNRAIRRANGADSYWQVAKYLPRETRNYVPAFIGASYAMNYATEHNVYPAHVDFSYFQDSIKIARQKLSLRALAQKTDASYQKLRRLNPALKRGVVPYTEEPYTLRVPHKVARIVMNNTDGKKIELASLKPVYNTVGQRDARIKTVYHTVQSGESLQEIAEAYNVTEQEIKDWNRFWAYNLDPGDELKIKVELTEAEKSARAQAQKQAAGEQSRRQEEASAKQTSSATASDAEPVDPEADRIYHRVQPDDTLESLARKYKCSVNKLRKLNDLTEEDELEAGQKLRIR